MIKSTINLNNIIFFIVLFLFHNLSLANIVDSYQDRYSLAFSEKDLKNKYLDDLSISSINNSTNLIDIRLGSKLSQEILNLRGNNFENSYGVPIDIDNWYSTSLTDIRFLFLTQLNKKNGILWGFSTGEYGIKYTINPSFILGFIHQKELKKNLFLTMQASFTLTGGNLSEKSCIADYGSIGGIQEVNCRMSASTIEPSETLKYLLKENNKDDDKLFIKLNYYF